LSQAFVIIHRLRAISACASSAKFLSGIFSPLFIVSLAELASTQPWRHLPCHPLLVSIPRSPKLAVPLFCIMIRFSCIAIPYFKAVCFCTLKTKDWVPADVSIPSTHDEVISILPSALVGNIKPQAAVKIEAGY
jgi:hypothetical protein